MPTARRPTRNRFPGDLAQRVAAPAPLAEPCRVCLDEPLDVLDVAVAPQLGRVSKTPPVPLAHCRNERGHRGAAARRPRIVLKGLITHVEANGDYDQDRGITAAATDSTSGEHQRPSRGHGI
jgi:hypothetical protein